MDPKGNVFSFLGLLVCMSIVYTANAMMCEINHPQTAVCNAAYVIKAEIINLNWCERGSDKSEALNPFKPKVMQARLLRLFKGYNAVNASKGDLIYISYPPYALPIKQGETYLLTGSSTGAKLRLSVCDWFTRWQDLTTSQKFGIRRYYYWLYCACRITPCYGQGCTTAKRPIRQCYINPDTSHCNSQKNICMVRGGRCDWGSPAGGTVCPESNVSSLP